MSRTRLRALTLAGAAAVLAGVGTVSYQASAAEVTTAARPHPTASASPVDPPADAERIIGSFRVVKGTQTYTCVGGVFVAPSVPEAKLAGPGGQVHHFAGPSWQSVRDGSLVTAKKTKEATRPGAIPELLLEVTSHSGPADGLLAKAAYIQRLATTGGVVPASSCTDGKTKAVPYGAVYVFLEPVTHRADRFLPDACQSGPRPIVPDLRDAIFLRCVPPRCCWPASRCPCWPVAARTWPAGADRPGPARHRRLLRRGPRRPRPRAARPRPTRPPTRPTRLIRPLPTRLTRPLTRPPLPPTRLARPLSRPPARRGRSDPSRSRILSSPSRSGRSSATPKRPRARHAGPAGSLIRTGSAAVALTFDDGPDPVQTPRLLDLLARQHVKATFCLVGRNVVAYPELVRRIADEGHTLCNHTWRHSLTLGRERPAVIRADLARTNDAIRRAVPGAEIKYMRAPGGNFTDAFVAAAQELGMTSIYWQVDPRDWDHPDGESDATHRAKVVRAVRTHVGRGAIVLSHDYRQPDTIAAYRELIPWLKRRYRLVALP